MFFHGEFLEGAIGAVHAAFYSMQTDMLLSNHRGHATIVVAITAVAGVAVAVAIGGTFLYNKRSQDKFRSKIHIPLTEEQWKECFEIGTGQLLNVEKLVDTMRSGGVEPSIRAEVWPFLVGFHDLRSTQAERDTENTSKREQYEKLRQQCRIMSDGFVAVDADDTTESGLKVTCEKDNDEILANTAMNNDESDADACLNVETHAGEPEKPNTEGSHVKKIPIAEDFATWQRIIRLDAVRMNAEWVPYSPSQANVADEMVHLAATSVGLKDDEHLEPCRRHHAARLVAILEAYSLYDSETGYCQGMSDLLSPFVALFDDDYMAFWCFVCFMQTCRRNFRLDEVGIRWQLNTVSRIIELSDPKLYSHLAKIQAEDCTFVYRMVVVLLRRELSFEQTICLWEVIWADKSAVRLGKIESSWKGKMKAPPTNILLLYVIAAAVRKQRKTIMEECEGMDEVLRICNGMAGNLEIWPLLDDARELVMMLSDKIHD